jgi:sarcosine oxidase
LDRFYPPHELGSSHGQTRIIRKAYFENPFYVPLVQRAYELWADLGATVEQQLLLPSGGVMIGPPEGDLVKGAQRSAQIHGLDYETLSPSEVRQRFPVLNPPEEWVAVWDPGAGILFPEACIRAHLDLARQQGASLRFDESVTDWEPEGGGVQVTTSQGRYHAGQLLLTAGAWLGGLVPELDLPLTVERQVLYWFEPAARSEAFLPDRCGVYVWEYEPDRHLYGFPNLGEGIKVGIHHGGEPADPDTVRRTVDQAEVDRVRALFRRYMTDADGSLLKTAVCMYTNTPDRHFLIDFHPDHPNVLIASPCSGHGFKFSSAIGETLADLLVEGQSKFDLSAFALPRLLST